MKCQLCQKDFVPDKYVPRQKYCSFACRLQARAVYKAQYDRLWRSRNPGYMRDYKQALNKGDAKEGFYVYD